MRQKRICEFLNLSCAHTLSFLDLPPAVRLLVYKKAGLPLDTTVALAPAAQREQHNGSPYHIDRVEGRPLGVVLGLITSCRALHDEVLAIILSRNTLDVRPDGLAYSLAYLRRLSPKHCASINRLRVEIRRSESSWSSHGDAREGGKKTKPLDAAGVTAWQDAASHLLAHVEPKKLSLCLICDQNHEGEDYSLSVTRPFFEYPGKLASLDLRLSARRNQRHSTLAFRAVACATGDYSHPAFREGVFRHFDLPKEIRTLILCYTALITPTRQVRWLSRTGYSWEDLQLPLADPMGGDGESCCRGLISYTDFEFCPSRCSGYTSTCRCFSPQPSLMLVSRAFYFESQAVFLANNTVSICPRENNGDGYDEKPWNDPSLSYWRVETSRFIMRYTYPALLSNLRYLELMFGEHDLLCCHDQNSLAHLDWSSAIAQLLTHANVPNLTVALYFDIVCGWERDGDPDQALYRQYEATDQDRRRRLIRAYMRVLTPLKRLAHLKRFFVYARTRRFMWCRCFEPLTQEDAALKLFEQYHATCRMESRMERFVMGDQYDARSSGKFDAGTVRWQTCQGGHLGFWPFRFD